MTVIDQWTGGHARALQAALRLTNEAFAEHLGVSARTVAKWRERPAMVPSPQLQEALDTCLDRAPADSQVRFASNLAVALKPVCEQEVRLDGSVLSRLNTVVGDLVSVLAELTEATGPLTSGKDRPAARLPSSMDSVQT